MRAKQLFGITVLDKKVKAVGKVDDVEIDVETGKVTTLIISLQKGILSNDSIEVDFDSIETIGDYILLNTEIEEEVEEEAEEAEQVTIEVEEE
ncbi:MAG: PRC-barrel domain-containing protein [Methanobrevibacter sp.]|uniref:PRC-barrel domain-containing protein n=1 Tax=Methanobrevibacter sp. TaxID=66852 RepID=UPI0025F806F5|nr:PRC-barrel domain-containing protein [Methanobrevibacter sp.]MBR0271216.1 PRC-barrel domain-containing protein [Methanobrevibacter sp.]